ncbi:MAG: ethanolamine ammonia-lyase reactivating factor EutA, partial [Chloroflexi bacterium]|nr:ethanolamine ammonia-lyase reactivating factor EutA [Chloroflexota bacterium]
MSVPPSSGFTAPHRDMAAEDRIVLNSVGVDIGSSTSHLLFSRLELERRDTRYVVVDRQTTFASEILLTPYSGTTQIDAERLARFVEQQYRNAGLRREDVDTGALILTGVALQRQNARAIADVFAAEAGRFVAVSAGDNLEATMAAHGSGSVTLSETSGGVLHVDIGGGTTKVVVCRAGEITELAAMDVGARLVAFQADGTVTRVEDAGLRAAAAAGVHVEPGCRIGEEQLRSIAAYMTDELLKELRIGAATQHSDLLRTEPLRNRR